MRANCQLATTRKVNENSVQETCSDITIGLPAEIAARQKQYEYYRDKLLTFKERPKEVSN